MAIQVTCPNCNQTHSLADALAGKTIKCVQCGRPVVAPAATPPPPAAGTTAPPPRSRLHWWLVAAAGSLCLLCLGCGGVGALLVFLLWPASKATPENFAKLKHGMTEKDLTALLGPPQPGA